MRYTLTDKLKYRENPEIQIKDAVITVKSDAETVLKIMDVMQTEGEEAAGLKAADLLFSPADRKKLMRLSMEDYMTVVATAMTLAAGGNPDEEPGEA
jgi:hypothetical protein